LCDTECLSITSTLPAQNPANRFKTSTFFFSHRINNIPPKNRQPRAQIEPADAASWRTFLRNIFDRAAAQGALGIKQLQAYRRNLDYQPRADGDLRWSGQRTPAETTVFQDWVMHECCRLADERGWPHQVHVGTNNLPQSDPLPLGPLARRYPNMKIVMIHCWPYLREAGWLAKFHSNVYIDTCWQPVLNPAFFREGLAIWWNYVPHHKITCGHDSTTLEMACGSALFTREILAESLSERKLNMGAKREIAETGRLRAATQQFSRALSYRRARLDNVTLSAVSLGVGGVLEFERHQTFLHRTVRHQFASTLPYRRTGHGLRVTRQSALKERKPAN
jgi:hypothetical protein